MHHETTTAPDPAPVITLAATPLARRLYRVEEAAEYHGIAATTVKLYVWERRLPTVVLPSRSETPTRRVRAIPAVWIDHWLDMADRDQVRLTDRAAFMAASTGPLYLTIAQAEATLGVRRNWLYRAVNRGDFPAPVSGMPRWRVSRAALDAWLWTLIADHERAWYGLDGVTRVELRPLRAVPA